MKAFYPHTFKTKMSCSPVIYLSREAYDAMWHYVDLSKEEVGWLGTVENRGNNEFLISEVFLIEQEVHAATTEISSAGLARLAEELMAKPGGMDKFNKIQFWGHSHVNMSTSASGQDQHQLEVLKSSNHPYFIRGILNKKGRMEFSILFYDSGIQIDDIPWKLDTQANSSMRNSIQKELAKKVRSKSRMAGEIMVGGRMLEYIRSK